MYLNTHAVNDSLLNAGIVRLSGALSAGATARCSFGVDLQGDAPANSSAVGVLAHTVRLAGTLTVTATTSAALRTVRVYTLNGTYLNRITVNAPNPVRLGAELTATAVATGTLHKAARLAGTALAGATLSGYLSTSQKLAATVTGTATTAGAATYTRRLAAVVSSSAVTSGSLTLNRQLEGILAATAVVVGAISKAPFAGSITGGYIHDIVYMSASTENVLAVVENSEILVAATTTSIYANAT